MNEKISGYARTSHVNHEESQSEVTLTRPDSEHRKRRAPEYTPGSIGSHLLFGLGTLAVVVIPPLIPGVSGRNIIMGVIGALVFCYTVVCVGGIVRDLRDSKSRTKGRQVKRSFR